MPVLFDWSGKLGKPGSETNRFWCGDGAECPWVNGERGPRCGLMHPPPEERQEIAAKKKDMESGQSDWREKFYEYFGGPDDMIKLRKEKNPKPGEPGAAPGQVVEKEAASGKTPEKEP